MPIGTILILIDAAIAMVEKLVPVVSGLLTSSEITPEQQQQLRERIDSLRAKTAGQFSGPEWEVTPTPEPPGDVATPTPEPDNG